MAGVSGTCTLNGTAIQGADVYVVDPAGMTVLASATSDANGDWSATISSPQTVHVISQYDDGAGTLYNSLSNPFLEVPAVIDDYESATPLSNYTGDTGAFTVTSSPTHSGSGALQGTGFTAKIFSTTGLDNYPTKPVEFEWYWLFQTVDATYGTGQTLWGTDANNHVGAGIGTDTDAQFIELERWESGSPTTRNTQTLSFTVQANTWYRCHVTHDDGATFGGADGEITFTIHDANSADSTTETLIDSTIGGGGFGIYTDNNHDWVWDDIILL